MQAVTQSLDQHPASHVMLEPMLNPLDLTVAHPVPLEHSLMILAILHALSALQEVMQ